jgi:hypothetical protein
MYTVVTASLSNVRIDHRAKFMLELQYILAHPDDRGEMAELSNNPE